MFYCPKCGTPNPDAASFCSACGAALQPPAAKPKKPLLIFIIALVAVALIAAGITFAVMNKNRTKPEPADTTVSETEQKTTQAPSTQPSAVQEPSTKKPAAEQPTATQAPTTQRSSWETAPAGQLYRPESSLFVNQYNAYVFCTDTDVQDYVKMRFGPSKTRFHTVGVMIPNYESVTVQTKSVNGWTLCFYNGTEGWIRSDFLFADRESIPDGSAAEPEEQEVEYYCADDFIVRVTGQYQGEPLNMREKPTRDSALVTTVPDGAFVRTEDNAPLINGWIQVIYQDPDTAKSYKGYVLFKYLEPAGDYGDKPVLYLYPEKTQTVQVQLDLAPVVRLDCTYPKYQDGWTVTANPDGTLQNLADGKSYSYLFWDMIGRPDFDFSRGFVVKGADTAAFLQKILADMGLTAREANEFIVYWLPKMEKNAYNLISFQTDRYTDNVGLCIQPEPDSLLRVFMAYQKLDVPVSVPAQTIQPFVRKGFTAVEWGGVEVLPDVD